MPELIVPLSGQHQFVVPDGPGQQRADRFVADVAGLSRSYVQRLISDGRLTHDGAPLKANQLVSAGYVLDLDVPPAVKLETLGEDIPLVIAYEDDDLLVVNKAHGLVVHPSPGHDSGTLVNALLGRAEGAEYGGIAGVRRPGIVHRLDRDTSGLLIVAKSDLAQASLMAQLKARRVKKTYLALVQGAVSAAVGRIEAPIGRDPKFRTRMAVVNDGRASTTGYRVRERFNGWTLLEVDLMSEVAHNAQHDFWRPPAAPPGVAERRRARGDSSSSGSSAVTRIRSPRVGELNSSRQACRKSRSRPSGPRREVPVP